jgi:hypothetical protein
MVYSIKTAHLSTYDLSANFAITQFMRVHAYGLDI